MPANSFAVAVTAIFVVMLANCLNVVSFRGYTSAYRMISDGAAGVLVGNPCSWHPVVIAVMGNIWVANDNPMFY